MIIRRYTLLRRHVAFEIGNSERSLEDGSTTTIMVRVADSLNPYRKITELTTKRIIQRFLHFLETYFLHSYSFS